MCPIEPLCVRISRKNTLPVSGTHTMKNGNLQNANTVKP